MKLYIKHMVSIPCKIVVRLELEKLGVKFSAVEMGYVDLIEDLDAQTHLKLKEVLNECGLDLIEDKKSILIERIKKVIIDSVNDSEDPLKTNFSVYLSEKLGYDYRYLATVFASAMGITIENYMIIHKIEMVKKMLIHDELSLSEISFKLNYSSIAHLSNQFKKHTGLTPSFFKNLQRIKSSAEPG